MIRLVWLFVVVVAIAAAAVFLADQKGQVNIEWGTHLITMSPVVAAGLVIAVMALLLASWRLIGFVFDWPGAMSHWRREKRRRAGYLSLARGMVAVAAGDALEARRHQARAKQAGDEPLLSQLLAAQVAQLEGNDEASSRAYADMLGRPETEFLGLRGLFVQAMRCGDDAAARRHAARAFRLRPQTPWVANALFDLEARAGDWMAAGKALEGQARAKLLTADVTRRRRAVLAAAEARDLMASGHVDAALKKAREALHIAPGLTVAALTAAKAWGSQSRIKRALAVLERAWGIAPHPDIAAAYAELQPSTSYRRFDRLIAANRTHAESRLLSAAQDFARRAFDEAEKGLQPLLTPFPGGRAAQLMADIAEARGDTAAARLWRDRSLGAPRDGVWRCQSCSHDHAIWQPTCPKCGAFDTLAWSEPKPVDAPAMLDSGAGTLLYRLLPAQAPDGVGGNIANPT